MNNELRELYIKKLGKTLSMEETIIEYLPRMIEAAMNEKLRAGLTNHLEETRAQRTRLIDILSTQTSEKETDEPFAMMVEEANREIEMITDPNVRDALIIAAAQSVEHIEMARYGTLAEWAKQLGEDNAASLLKDTLGEEKAADKTLTTVAEGGIFAEGVNEMAAAHR
jgi:ferritin-like metal-binding protein YciE